MNIFYWAVIPLWCYSHYNSLGSELVSSTLVSGSGRELNLNKVNIEDVISERFFYFEKRKLEVETSITALNSEERIEEELGDDLEKKSYEVKGNLWANMGFQTALSPAFSLGSRISYLFYSEIHNETEDRRHNLKGWGDPSFFGSWNFLEISEWKLWFSGNYRMDAYETSVTSNRHKLGSGLSAQKKFNTVNFFTGLNGNKYFKKHGKRSYHDIFIFSGFEFGYPNGMLYCVEGMFGYRERRVISVAQGSFRTDHEYSDNTFEGLSLSVNYHYFKDQTLFLIYQLIQNNESKYTRKMYTNGGFVSASSQLEKSDAEIGIHFGLRTRF